MKPCVLEDTKKSPMVLMGQITILRQEEMARAVLGSCIGLAICDTVKEICAVAHIVLPAACERNESPGKFADTAIPEMIRLLSEHKALRSNLIAKFSGGAEMFEKLGPLRIGEENIKAVTDSLNQLKIPILGTHTGGCKGRRISCSAFGEMNVEVLGQSAVQL